MHFALRGRAPSEGASQSINRIKHLLISAKVDSIVERVAPAALSLWWLASSGATTQTKTRENAQLFS
jgi:hypothetical protein